jgi:transposase
MHYTTKMAKKRTKVNDAARRQVALAAMQAHKFAADRAAHAIGYSKRYVTAQLVKYQKRGNVSALPRSGRPKLLSAAQIEAAAAAVEELQCVAKAAAVLRQQGTIASSISNKTVARAVKSLLELAPVQPRPILSAATKMRRMAFSRQDHDSNSIIAIDSTYLTLCSSQRKRKKWVRKGTKPVANKPNKGQQLHVYGGITKYGVTRLFRVTGTTQHPQKYFRYDRKLKVQVPYSGVGAEEFQEVLLQHLQPQAQQLFSAAGVQDWSFLLDGASAHRCPATVAFMSSNDISSIADWPPNSPDLNPIENAWAWLKRQVYAQQYASLEAMWQAAESIWAAMPLSMCENLMNSIATRKAICLEREGAYTGY